MRSMRVALAAAALLALALTPSPLLGVHGIESALILAVVLPFFVAPVGIAIAHAARHEETSQSAWQLLRNAILAGLLVLGVAMLVLALNALRIRQCAPLEGLALMVLGPAFGVAFAAAIGVAFGVLFIHPRIAVFAALLSCLLVLARGAWEFWATPAVFVYNHLAGYFPGPLYDAELHLPLEYVTFRLVTLGIVLAIGCVLHALWTPHAADMSLRRLVRQPGPLLLGVLLAGAVWLCETNAAALGHRTNVAHIKETLAASTRGTRCSIRAPREITREALSRLARDCDFRVAEAERVLGVRQKARITAFFFRDAEEKRKAMGAANTYIAKPWRNEVYLQVSPWPHPVLAHEIAHVVAGNVAPGPFRVASRFGGIYPEPALIEGLAVAVAWDSQDELTPHQWAHALMRIEKMPRLADLFGLSFMTQPARHAYTAAGSFLRFVLDKYGAAAVRRAYLAGNISKGVGKPLDALEREWRTYLRTVPLSNDAIALAALRYSGKSIFSAVCPRQVAELRDLIQEDIASGDDARLVQTCDAILSIDARDANARAARVAVLARAGNTAAAAREIARLRKLSAPPPVIAAARESTADAAWLRGDAHGATTLYRALLGSPQPEQTRRLLEVKLTGITGGEPQASFVRTLLLGRDGRPATPAAAVHLARQINAVRADGLGAYLEARQLVNEQRYDLALDPLARAEARTLPTPRLAWEARRLIGAALFDTKQLDRAATHYRRMRADAGNNAARRYEAEDWLHRIRFTERTRHTLTR